MIVVFGSLNADMVFPVMALPRPGETVASRQARIVPGGKGANQAVAACRAGAKVRMVGRVGRDAFGDLLIDSLTEAGVDAVGVGRADAATGAAAIAVDAEGRNQIIVAGGANMAADAGQIDAAHLSLDTTVLLQMEVAAEENWKVVERARAAGARVLLNAAPANPVPARVLDSLDYLVVNEIECQFLAADLGLGSTDPAVVARTLAAHHGLGCVVTTGSGGAFAAFADTAVADGDWSVGALPIIPVDTTAAGDAFAGVFAAALDRGATPIEALHRASVAGGLACLTMGAQPSLPDAEAVAGHLGDLAPPARTAG